MAALSCAFWLPVDARADVLASSERARELFESARYEEALSEARAVIGRAPADATAHLVAGAALVRLGRFEEAERDLERALKLDDGLPRVRYQLGVLAVERAKRETEEHHRRKGYGRAARWFDQELELSPGACSVLEARAKAKILGEPSRGALDEVEEWVEACPSATDGWALLARHYVGRDRRKRLAALPDRVPSEFAAARASVLWYIAALHLVAEERASALEALEDIVGVEPRSSERAAAEAAVKALRGSYEGSEEVFERLACEREAGSWAADEPLLALALSLLDGPTGHAMELPSCKSGGADGIRVALPDMSGVVLPVLARNAEPEYPEDLRAARTEGTVLLHTMVTKSGRLIPLRVLQSNDIGFTRAALRSVIQWRYAPGRLAGTPVDIVGYVVRIDFRLR